MTILEEIEKARELLRMDGHAEIVAKYSASDWVAEFVYVASTACFNERGLRRSAIRVAAKALDCIEECDRRQAELNHTSHTKEKP
jgi:hypothetical protein